LEEARDAPPVNRREEVDEIELQDDGGPDVRRRVRDRRAAGQEAMGGGVHWHLREKLVEHLPLRRAERLARRGDAANAPRRHVELDVGRALLGAAERHGR
jgi:hypothetical protein